jgi:hypothetical protein
MSAALLVSEGVRLGGWIAPFDLRVRWESSATSHVLSVCSISQHWWPQQHNGPAWGGLLSQYSFFGLHFLRSSAETLIKGPQMQKAHHWSAAQLVHAYVITNVFCVCESCYSEGERQLWRRFCCCGFFVHIKGALNGFFTRASDRFRPVISIPTHTHPKSNEGRKL